MLLLPFFYFLEFCFYYHFEISVFVASQNRKACFIFCLLAGEFIFISIQIVLKFLLIQHALKKIYHSLELDIMLRIICIAL